MKVIVPIVIGMALSLLLGKCTIPLLQKIHVGQNIREDGPKTHLSKSGTPTIGGIIFLGALVLGILVTRTFKGTVFMILVSTLGFGLVGFIDDYIKVLQKRNLGLTALHKLLLQIVVAVILLIYQYHSNSVSPVIYVPLIQKVVSFGFLYVPFILFVVVGTVNSVNLTDGLDGLSSGVTIITLGFFALVAHRFQRPEIVIFCLLLAGALMGFLYYNRFPAKVFMGDTGSLALGGAISAIAVLLNVPLILPIAGGVYFMETLSVIIQVISFKTRGKRVFLMSPLHHHFEQKGWREHKVVITFYVTQFILCLIAYAMLF